MKKIWLVVLLLVTFADLKANEQAQQLFSSANESYIKGDYAAAINNFKKIINTGQEAWQVYFNLGNCYFKSDSIPLAILYYEKAKKLKPAEDDITFNLQMAYDKTTDKMNDSPDLFFYSWGRNFVNSLSLNLWSAVITLAFALALTFFFFYFRSSTRNTKIINFWLGAVLLIVALIASYSSYQQYQLFYKQKEAIVFAYSVNIKSAPGGGTTLFVLHEGSKVLILETENDWLKIKIPDGTVGWIPSNALREI